jgi:hypothetical protein
VSDVWLTIVVLTVGTALIKASGPVLVGGRDMPPIAVRMIILVAPAILAGLVMIETFTSAGGEVELDARAAGLAAAAGVLVWRRSALLPAVAVAAVVAALVRAIT